MAANISEQSHFSPTPTWGAGDDPEPEDYADQVGPSEGNSADPDGSSSCVSAVPDMLQRARDRYTERREIDRIFDMDGFVVSSCWDIMLRFYGLEAVGQVTQLPAGSADGHRPQTTCARWLNVLVDMGLLEQTPVPQGVEEDLYRLTPKGRAATERALLIG